MGKFDGKTVVITGASSGIGRQTAIDFAKSGARVVLVARSEERLGEIADIIKDISQVIVYPCDVSDKDAVREMGLKILDSCGGHIDILVNNAGIGKFGRVSDQSMEEIESVIDTNFYGMIYCTKAFLGSMLVRRSGHIINVASAAASFGIPGLAAYCGSKFAMLGFSESLYHELSGTGVHVTVVSPVGVKTNFFNNKSFQGKMPNYTGFSLDPKTVSKAILSAANSPRLEIMVPFFIRGGVWLKHTLPYIVNPVLGAFFRRQLNN